MAKQPPHGYQPRGKPVDLTKTKPPGSDAPPAPRLFPIQGSAAIPWAMIEPHEFQCQLNHYANLERMATRGGLSAQEVIYILDHRNWGRPGEHTELRDWEGELARRADQWKRESFESQKAELIAAVWQGVHGYRKLLDHHREHHPSGNNATILVDRDVDAGLAALERILQANTVDGVAVKPS